MTPARLALILPLVFAAHNAEEEITMVTLVGAAVGPWAFSRPRSRAALWALLLLQAVLLVNVLSHLAAALLLRGYSPGLATALLLNLPLSIYVLRTAVQRKWLPRAALAALTPAALLVHGPLLLGLLALIGTGT